MAIGSIFHHEQNAPGAVADQATVSHFMEIRPCRTADAKYKTEVRNSTMDIIVIGIGILFFALSFAYVKACDRI